MKGSRLNVDWERQSPQNSHDRCLASPAILQEKGIRDSTIEGYGGNVRRYLEFVQTDHPTSDDYSRYRESLHSWKLSRSTLNQYGYSVKAYHEMIREPIKFKRIAPNNQIPFYFTDEDVDKIFSVISNLKHLAMLSTLFYGCLRANELCQLNDDDLDLNSLTLRVSGKGGYDGLACISHECSTIIKEYLEVRTYHLVEGRQPLFYTDYGQRWRRMDLHYMFKVYKKKAGIEKRGGAARLWQTHTCNSDDSQRL